MRKIRNIIIGNTQYKLIMSFQENGKKLINVRKEVQENPYCWEVTHHNINMSWRRFKKALRK